MHAHTSDLFSLTYAGRTGRPKTPMREKALPNKLKELEEPDQVTLRLQVEALQSQISDQAR